ncbi:MAG: hypothetical protein WDN69_05285 [Aliidongia sp.]
MICAFPYNNRSLVLGWRTLYFTEGEYQPDPAKSAEWNRGAYLVQGLGHCSMWPHRNQCAGVAAPNPTPSRAA